MPPCIAIANAAPCRVLGQPPRRLVNGGSREEDSLSWIDDQVIASHRAHLSANSFKHGLAIAMLTGN
jgi:hypothetical protein